MNPSERNVGTGRPEDITAVPVRRPGRWIAARDHPDHRRVAGPLGRQQHALPLAYRRPLPVRRAGSCTGSGRDAEADGDLDGRSASSSGSSLAVMRLSPNPLVSRGELALHLVLPRHAAAGPALFWYYIAALCSPRSRLGVPFGGPAIINANANSLIPTFVGGHPRPGAQRGRLHGGDRPRRHHLGRARARPRRRLAGHVPPADDAPSRAAAGDAGDHPADRQRDRSRC